MIKSRSILKPIQPVHYPFNTMGLLFVSFLTKKARTFPGYGYWLRFDVILTDKKISVNKTCFALVIGFHEISRSGLPSRFRRLVLHVMKSV